MNCKYFLAFTMFLVLTLISTLTSAQEMQDEEIFLPDKPLQYFISATLSENIQLLFATGEADAELRMKFADKRLREYELMSEKEQTDDGLLERLQQRRLEFLERAEEIAEERNLTNLRELIEEHKEIAEMVMERTSLIFELRDAETVEEREEIIAQIEETTNEIQDRREQFREEIEEDIEEEVEEFQEEREERIEEREETREEVRETIGEIINNSQNGNHSEGAVALNGRVFYLERPQNSEGQNLPVIVLVHGRQQHAEVWFDGIFSQSTFADASLERGYALIAPESIEPVCERVKQWDYKEDSQDLEFIGDIFSYVENDEYLDENNIFVVGISNGAYMTSRIAMHFGNEKINAAVVHSGGNANTEGPTLENNCMNFDYEKKPVTSNHPPVLILHGTADPIVPYDAGESYYDSLISSSIEARMITKNFGLHNWFDEYNEEILDWLDNF